MFIKKAMTAVVALGLALPLLANAAPVGLDDGKSVLTVMQFTAKANASKAELKKRMIAMRDFQRAQPGYVENTVMENTNPASKPDYVGVSRWASFKEWEAMWLKPEFQKLVASVGEVGVITPGTFQAVK
jgi:heme-degrading monooxygenase HmoA